MPEISLKDYYAKLNSLLSSSAADEVIHHSRHILKYYPKNVTATRFLGRGLVLNGRWEEGREALRRVLSVIPDDYPAHLALSEANERMNRPDEAIWHLERAFEQRPNDKDLIDGLRGLYRRYRQIDNLKIQLTSAAVARQYLRSGAYTQAIDALRGALARLNDRLDLKLLLAQTLWQQGSKEEAAEIALEVLKILPDCLEANRIMALLWLESGRPSDAQRYVNHLEGVDPYLAVELAQGAPPEDDAFRLDELDYARSSQSEMTSARPDWLREISTAPSPVEEPVQQPASELSDWASAMLGTQKPPQQAARPSAEKGTTSSRFAAMKGDEPPSSGLTDVFGKPEESNTAELNALFDSQPADDDEDPMAWLRDTGVQLVEEDDEPAFKNLFDDDDSPLPDTDQDPMAWLKDTDEGAVLETNGAAADDPYAWANSGAGQKNAATTDTDDSLDWLRGSDLLDEALDLDDISEGTPADLATQKMQIPGAKKPETEAPESGTNVPGPRRGLTSILQESNFEWVNKQDEVVSDDEMDDWLNQFGVTEPRKAAGEAPDWLNDLEQPEMSRLEADEWFKPDETPTVPELPVVRPDELVLMSDEDDEDSDWLAEFAPQETQPTADDEFAWQKPQETPAEMPVPVEAEPAEEIPDWLSSLEPEDEDADELDEAEDEEPAADDEFAWLTDDALTTAEGTASDAMDWFAELEPEAIPEGETETPATADGALARTSDTLEADAEPISEEVPDWLSDLQNQPAASDVTADETKLDTEFAWTADASVEAEAVEEQPDWLADLAPEGVTAEAQPPVSDADFSWMTVDETPSEPAAVVSDIDFSWMSEETPEEDEAAAEPDSVPDWLSELQPSAVSEPVVETSGADTDFTWLTEDEPVESEAEPAEMGEAPDWLSELQPSAASEPLIEAAASDTDFAWMSENDAPTEDEVAPAEMGETPDWLSELEPAAEAEPEAPIAEAAAVSDADFTWLSEDDLSVEADVEPAEIGETPDWLSELQPAEAEEPEAPIAEAAAVSDAEFSWLSEEEPAAEAEVEPAEIGETPDWLSELQPAEAAEPEAPIAEAAAVSDSDFAWMSEEEPAAEAEVEPAEMGETPDWLSELQPAEAAASEPIAEPVVNAEFSWTSEEDAPNEDEVEPAEMGETPDWLSALQPTASEPSATAAVGDEFAWLTDEEEDEEIEAEMAFGDEPEAVGEDSDWLSDLGLPSEASAVEPERVDAEITWTSDESQPPAAELEPASAEELDWLNELAPQAASEDKEFATEESADDEFNWISEVESTADDEDEEAFEFEEAEPVMAVEALGGDEDDVFDDELASEDDEDEMLEPTPAQNAPDWLNAMVPGLDVDYEPAGAAEPEEEFEEPAAEAAATEFAWLTEMVDEETAVTSRPRFVFSRPPVWLQPTNGAAHAEVVDDDLPDWPSDDADADVPEWLR